MRINTCEPQVLSVASAVALAEPGQPDLAAIQRERHTPEHAFAFGYVQRFAETITGVTRTRKAQGRLAVRFGVPGHPDLVAARGNRRAIDRTTGELPAVAMHVARWRPGVVLQPHEARVADFAVAAAAVDHDRPARGLRDGGRAAVAGRCVERPLDRAPAVRGKGRGAQHHAAAAVVGMRMPGMGVGGRGRLLPAVEPGDAERVARLRPHRDETVVVPRAVRLDADRSRPGRAVIVRAHEGDAVVMDAGAVSAQPVRPQRAIAERDDVRRVGPVDEPVLAGGNRARHAPARRVLARARDAQGLRSVVALLGPCQQPAPVRRRDEVGLRGWHVRRRQWPRRDGEHRARLRGRGHAGRQHGARAANPQAWLCFRHAGNSARSPRVPRPSGSGMDRCATIPRFGRAMPPFRPRRGEHPHDPTYHAVPRPHPRHTARHALPDRHAFVPARTRRVRLRAGLKRQCRHPARHVQHGRRPIGALRWQACRAAERRHRRGGHRAPGERHDRAVLEHRTRTLHAAGLCPSVDSQQQPVFLALQRVRGLSEPRQRRQR